MPSRHICRHEGGQLWLWLDHKTLRGESYKNDKGSKVALHVDKPQQITPQQTFFLHHVCMGWILSDHLVVPDQGLISARVQSDLVSPSDTNNPITKAGTFNEH